MRILDVARRENTFAGGIRKSGFYNDVSCWIQFELPAQEIGVRFMPDREKYSPSFPFFGFPIG